MVARRAILVPAIAYAVFRLRRRRSAEPVHEQRRRRRMPRALAGVAAGAALEYFLDPEQGRRRRSVGKDRMAGAVRRAGRRAGRGARYAATTARGKAQQVTQSERTHDYNEPTLAHKVESEVLGNPSIPKGKINVNVEDGVVVLRGEVDHPEQVREIERAVERVPGVRGVRSLLHPPNTPAPPSG